MANNISTDNDVLSELSTEELVKLGEFYKNHQDSAPHIYSHIQTALQWQAKAPEKRLMQFFVPDGGWGEHGTFVSYGHFPWKMLIVYTLEKSCERLYNAMVKTNRFDFKQSTLFYAIEGRHISAIDRAMKDRGLKHVNTDSTDLWVLDQKEGASKIASFPDEYKMAQLNTSDSFVINDLWPHKSDDSEGYVKILIEMGVAYGLFTKEGNELAAWILTTNIGQLGLLQVRDEHQRKGLAAALINKLTKDIADQGFPICATILGNNVASQKLFTKCGFKSKCLAAFSFYSY